MTDAEKIEAFTRTELFRELDEETLGALARRAVERKLGRGEMLFVAGEEARGLYVVVTGALRAFRTGADGREQTIHVERAPATIAEVPVFDDKLYPSSVAAEEDATLLFLDKRDVRRLCLEHPQIALAALKLLAGRLRRCAELVETLSLQEVGQRLAKLLLSEAERAGVRRADGIHLELKLTNSQIAARVGSVREVVSRALARLQADELIVIKHRRIIIRDAEGLAAYAGK